MQGEGKVFAFGHAWVEYWNGHRWDPLDATPTRKAPDVRYIPTQVLMDEGPAFEAHIMQSMGAALLVKRAFVAPL
jgi:transglutaminase-like putative cysteine protease